MKPFKGIFQDCNFVDQPEGFYRDSQNIIYNKLKNSICNEGGFEQIDVLPSGSIFNGSVRLEMSTIVIYTLNDSVYFKEFKNGLLGNDLFVVLNTILNLNPNYPVRGIFFNNNKGERIIVIIDGLNSPKIINLDIQQRITSSNSYLIELFPKGNVPVLNNITVNNSGGSLPTGTYAFAINYVFDDSSETNYFSVSNFIPIFRASNNISNNKFVGNSSEVVTSKSITLNLTNLDTSYKKLNIAIIKYINGNFFVNKVSYTYNSQSKVIIITGNENSEALLLEEIITKRISYDTANALTYSNKKLYLADLNKNSFPDFRKHVHNIRSKWIFDNVVNLDIVEDSHKDNNTIALKTSFMPDEVYAFWIVFNLKDGTQSPAFHIPGRDLENNENEKIQDILDSNPTYTYLEHDLKIDPNIRYFHTRDTSYSNGALSYWQNENEVYDASYDSSLVGKNIRHHKFPSLSKLYDYKQEWIKYGTNEIINNVYDEDVIDIIGITSNYFDIYLSFSVEFNISGQTFDIKLYHGNVILYQFGQQSVSGEEIESDNFSKLNCHISNGDAVRIVIDSTDSPVINANLKIYQKQTKIQNLNGRILGIKFENIIIPNEIKEIADSYEIFYTKRTESNSTVIAQSLLFKENSTINTISNIGINDSFSIHPADLIKNQEYPGINPSYIKYQINIEDIGNNTQTKGKTLNVDQIYNRDNIYNDREILPIEDIEYKPYLSESKKETRLVGRPKVEVITVSGGKTYAYLANLCNYLPDVYTNSTFIVGTGISVPILNTSTGDLYKGDMYLSEYSLRCTPEYENEFGTDNFGKRLAYGTYSFACFNKSNIGLRLDGEDFGETFYPLKNIITSPSLLNTFTNVWGTPVLENETPDYYDNYLVINNDLYKKNDISVAQPKEDSDEIEYFPNLIIQSESVQYGSKGGNIRTFLPVNYYEMPKNKGKIINLDSKGKDVIIHLEDSIYRTVSEVRLDPTQVNVTLGSGKIFDIDPDEILPITGGYAGTQHWTSCFMTKAGYFFVDNRRKKIFLMSDTLEEISNYGMKTFFEENLDFEINKQLISKGLTTLTANNPNYQYGIGYVVGFDDKYNRILFTKRDFKVKEQYLGALQYHTSTNGNGYLTYYTLNPLYPESEYTFIENKSFTISYSLETKSWTSFHTYHPQWWLYNYNIPFTLYKGNNSNYSLYSFNNDFKNGMYYKQDKDESYIEFIFNEQPTINKLLENISWEDSFIADDGIIDNGQTFDAIEIKNSYQSTNIIPLQAAISYRDSNANIAKKVGVWNFNNIVSGSGTYKDKKRFIDKYNSVRLINTNQTQNILYLSNIDVRQRFSQF